MWEGSEGVSPWFLTARGGPKPWVMTCPTPQTKRQERQERQNGRVNARTPDGRLVPRDARRRCPGLVLRRRRRADRRPGELGLGGPGRRHRRTAGRGVRGRAPPPGEQQ